MSRHSDIVKDDLDSVCEVDNPHSEIVSSVKAKLGEGEENYDLAELFKALSDPTRVSILRALSISELCVCDLSEIVGVSQSAISHQLRFLRISRLVKFRKEGKKAFYSLDDDHVRHQVNGDL